MMLPSSTVDLYEELVQCLLPKCSLPQNTLALHSLTVQNAGSLFRGRNKRCLSQAIFQLKQSLAKRRAPHEAFGFVECLDSYCTQSGVASEVAPVVEVLNALAESSESGNDYRNRAFGTPKELDSIIQDTLRTRSHPPRPPRREDTTQRAADSLKLDRAQPKSDIALVSTDLPSTDFDSGLPEPLPLLPSRKSPPQWILLRDCLVVLQGVDGQYLKWCEKAQRFQGDSSVEISAPIRVLMGRMTEAGGCLRTILSLLKHPSARDSLLRLALDEAVRIELDDYQKSVAALEMALFNGPSAAEGVELRALTLRSVAVSLAEPLAILQTLREVVEKSRPIIGGEIISLLISFRNTTLPLFKPLLSRLVESTSIPLLEMIRIWTTGGKLSDPHQEFFISSQPYQEDPFLFWTQYRVVPRLVPLSIGMDTARDVLVTGKTVAFISLFGSGHPLIADRSTVVAESASRHQNEDYFRFNTSSPPRSKNIFDVNCVPSLLQLEKGRITKLIFEGFELLPQLEFVKRTLLTAQGDFLCSFLAETESALCRPRSLGSAFDLKSLLIDSLESTPGLAKFERFFPLLSLSLSDGKRVWDSLEMSYRVSHLPLKCVLNSETDEALKQLFRLLFRVKFASRMLARTFSATGGRNSLEGAGLLRECQRLRSEMQHLASSLESYFVCDVVHSVWDLQDFEAVVGLDEIRTVVMETFRKLLTECFLCPDDLNRSISRQVQQLLDLIVEFALVVEALEEVAWHGGGDVTSLADTIHTLATSFHSGLFHLLMLLRDADRSKQGTFIRALRLRLDFNDYYGSGIGDQILRMSATSSIHSLESTIIDTETDASHRSHPAETAAMFDNDQTPLRPIR